MDVGKLPNHVNIILCVWLFSLTCVFSICFVSHRLEFWLKFPTHASLVVFTCKILWSSLVETTLKIAAIGICQSKSSLTPFGFSCYGSYPSILNGISNGLINSTKKSRHTYFLKNKITPIKVGRCIKGLRSIHLTCGLGSHKDIEIRQVYPLWYQLKAQICAKIQELIQTSN